MKVFRNIYGVYGMVEWSTLIPTGGSNLRIDFTNGSINSRGIDPATFTTDIPGVQFAIENSPKFKSGKIKKVKSFVIGEIPDEVAVEQMNAKTIDADNNHGTDGASNEGSGSISGINDGGESGSNAGDDGAGSNDEGADENNKYADVKNSQQAKAILMGEPYNVPLADLGNKQAILDKAAELNVVFSNWK